jgi:hypothetical protein
MSLPRQASLVALLSVSSLWQVVSGYADVYSHRFVFRNGDPVLNPAHISLYMASALGFFAVFLSLRATSNMQNGAFRLGLRVAAVGVVAEIATGLFNELYHRLIVNYYPSQALHFTIHGSFVLAMMSVAVGGLLASSAFNLKAKQCDQRALGRISVGLFLSALWLLVLGSLAYVAGSLGSTAAPAYVVIGAFLASLIAGFGWRANRGAGVLILAAFVYFFVTTLLEYFIADVSVYFPFPVLAALGAEVVWNQTRRFRGSTRSILSGAVIGLLSYWLLYPYPYFFYQSYAPSLVTTSSLAILMIAGVVGGIISFGVSSKIGRLLFSAGDQMKLARSSTR